MSKSFISIAAILGAIAVGLGAFAAHALKERLLPENLQIFETAVKYQFYHVFVLLIAGVIFNSNPIKLKWTGNLFITGIIIFCGSLYLLAFSKQYNWGINWLGAIIPLGGVCFIAGWLLLAMAFKKSTL
jgi:uncharacterized membrane protein YgdD (TMEM256/DUF423 family)